MFCPKTESLFDSLEWWGENAFFSRSTSCSDLSSSCGQCLTQEDLSCLWCLQGGDKCQEWTTPNIPATCVGPQIFCLTQTDPIESTFDEDAEEIFLEVNPYVILAGEDNQTESSTSEKLTVSVLPTAGTCTGTFSADSNQVVVTQHRLHSTADCEFTLQFTSIKTSEMPIESKSSIEWIISFTPQNDGPVVGNPSAVFVSESVGIPAGDSVTFNGCGLFADVDSDFDLGFSFDGDDLEFEVTTCTCFSDPDSGCVITVTAAEDPSSSEPVTVTITGIDVEDGSLEVPFEWSFFVIPETPELFLDSEIPDAEIEENSEDSVVINLADYIKSTDEESSLIFDVSGFSLAQMSLDGSELTITAVEEHNLNGTETITVTARIDGIDDSSFTTTFTLIVSSDDDAPVYSTDSLGPLEHFAGTSTDVDLNSIVSDEDNYFGDGVLECELDGTNEFLEVTFTDNIMNIAFEQITPDGGTTFTVNCADAITSGSFSVSVVISLNNHAPTVTPFTNPELHANGTAFSLDLDEYFADEDVIYGDEIIFSASSENSAITVSVTDATLSVTLSATSSGNYQVSVTATDSQGLSATQVLNVHAYVPPSCGDISKTWNSLTPLVIDFNSECPSSMGLTVTFTENPLSGSLYELVTPTVSGSELTLTSSSSCQAGSYSGVASITDGVISRSVTVRVQLVSSSTTLTARNETITITVVNTSPVSSDLEILDGAVLRIPFANLIYKCGATNVAWTIVSVGTPNFWDNASQNNDNLHATIVPGLNAVQINGPNTRRRFDMTIRLRAKDTKSGFWIEFDVKLVKPFF